MEKSNSTVVSGDTFLVTDPNGRFSQMYDGFYNQDTRHLSEYALDVAEHEMEVLDITKVRPGERAIHLGSEIYESARALHLVRRQILTDGLYERIEVTNFSKEEHEQTLSLDLATDFADIFEIRGSHQYDRAITATQLESDAAFAYDPDNIEFTRKTAITSEPISASEIDSGTNYAEATLTIDLTLKPRETAIVSIACTPGDPEHNPTKGFTAAEKTVRNRERAWYERISAPRSENCDRQPVLDQSVEDLLTLTIDTSYGPIFAAGFPWFAAPFGRDSLIAAYQALPLTDEPARGTLRYLAAHQATETNEFQAATPGKIFHELRQGELVAREDVPHSPYYGTIDATALWVILLHETWRYTADNAFVEEMWDTLSTALQWCDKYGDHDDDGFLEYPTDGGGRGTLINQAWKDSPDGIVHTDGTSPNGPLAVAEVQGYYYDALRRAAELYREVGNDYEQANALNQRASDLKTTFNEKYWLPEKSYYAAALDGTGTPVASVTSNPGHCLWSGIVPVERADAVVERLVAPDMFTGWGIRTLSADHSAYNPQSYHRGSVWPHDNSLIVLGMAQYDYNKEAATVVEGLFDAATERGTNRLPELFAGFERDATEIPIQYGDACEPQAWAAGTPVACLTALR